MRYVTSIESEQKHENKRRVNRTYTYNHCKFTSRFETLNLPILKSAASICVVQT